MRNEIRIFIINTNSIESHSLLSSLCPKLLSLLPLSITSIIDNHLVQSYLSIQHDNNDLNDNDDNDENDENDESRCFRSVVEERRREAKVCEDLLLRNNDMTIQSLETVIEVGII